MGDREAAGREPFGASPDWTHYPCLIVIQRHGRMDEDGNVHRPEHSQTKGTADSLSNYCDLVAIGRFTAVYDEHFDAGIHTDAVVTATFVVSEVLIGENTGPVRIGIERNMLASPGDPQNRLVRSYRDGAIRAHHRDAALDGLDLLEGIYDGGRSMTAEQHGRLADLLREAAWGSPPVDRYQLYQWVDTYVATGSRLSFHHELGSIRRDTVFLIGLSAATNPVFDGPGKYSKFIRANDCPLFWGTEAEDLAAEFRRRAARAAR